ncbi:MAG: ferredoxin family protein [Caldimicrobium sp.]
MEVNIDEKIGSVKFYVDEKYPHLKIKNTEICKGCEKKPCLNFCPAGVYRLEEENKILISYQACLECGSCRVGCPFSNIVWDYPRSGFGVNYKFG